MTIAVADPSSTRVWRASRVESAAAAFGRGFLRGFLGLPVGRRGSSVVPTGIDRIGTSGTKRFGYDSASRVLYRIDGKKARIIASDLGPAEFALTPRGVIVWDGTGLVRVE